MNPTSDRMRPAFTLTALTVLGLLLALPTGCAKKQQAGGGGFSMPPMPVETATVRSGSLTDRFSVVGSLEASDAITVVSEIGATVKSLPFKEGQPIGAGELIAQLDDRELRAQVDRAQALRDQQQATYDRIAAIVDQGAGAPQDLDDAAAALKMAEADLALGRARLAKTRITAPFAGVTGARRVSQGAYVAPGTPITDLARYDELRVNFTAPERLLGLLKRGATVTVTTTAFPDHPVEGTVDIIDPQLDPQTRSARIVARVANPGRLLRPGMSAQVSLVLASQSNALTLPSEAVFIQGGQTMVYVVGADSTVAPRPIALGLRLPERVEVSSGLAADERVVRAGHQKIYPGAKVMPIPESPGGGGAEGRQAGGGA
ncbi:MAG: efflux RND transporter periplasmic adaptor subunit [Candidatus Krumholzibacteriia bacterium]